MNTQRCASERANRSSLLPPHRNQPPSDRIKQRRVEQPPRLKNQLAVSVAVRESLLVIALQTDDARLFAADPFVLVRTTIPTLVAELLAVIHHGRRWNNQHLTLKTRGFHSGRDCDRDKPFRAIDRRTCKKMYLIHPGLFPEKNLRFQADGYHRTQTTCTLVKSLVGQALVQELPSTHDIHQREASYPANTTEFPRDFIVPASWQRVSFEAQQVTYC